MPRAQSKVATMDSRSRLTAAATQLFVGGSFHKVGIAEICSSADINKGTFYHYFPSKIELLIDVLESYVSDIERRLRALAESDVPATEKIKGVFGVAQKFNETWKAEHGASPGCFLGNVILELGAQEPDVRAKANEALGRWRRAITPMFEEFFKKERIYNLDAGEAAEIVLGIAQGANVMAKAKNDTRVFRAYSRLAVELIRAAADPR